MNKVFFTQIANLNDFVDYFVKSNKEQFTHYILSKKPKLEIDEGMMHAIELKSYGEAYITLKWIKTGMKKSPDMMAKDNAESFPPRLEKFFKK